MITLGLAEHSTAIERRDQGALARHRRAMHSLGMAFAVASDEKIQQIFGNQHTRPAQESH